jgi:hypothetical protein
MTSSAYSNFPLVVEHFHHACREETFNNFGDKLDRKTVVHNWYFLSARCFLFLKNYQYPYWKMKNSLRPILLAANMDVSRHILVYRYIHTSDK